MLLVWGTQHLPGQEWVICVMLINTFFTSPAVYINQSDINYSSTSYLQPRLQNARSPLLLTSKRCPFKALNTHELAYIFRSDPQEEDSLWKLGLFCISHSHCVPSLSVQLFYFGGRSLLFWSSYATQQACTCNVRVCYVLRESQANEDAHPLPNNILREEHVDSGLTIPKKPSNAH